MTNEGKKKAVSVYLAPPLYELIEKLSRISGEGKSTIIERATWFGIKKVIELYEIKTKI